MDLHYDVSSPVNRRREILQKVTGLDFLIKDHPIKNPHILFYTLTGRELRYERSNFASIPHITFQLVNERTLRGVNADIIVAHLLLDWTYEHFEKIANTVLIPLLGLRDVAGYYLDDEGYYHDIKFMLEVFGFTNLSTISASILRQAIQQA